jgi:hypothetical protein
LQLSFDYPCCVTTTYLLGLVTPISRLGWTLYVAPAKVIEDVAPLAIAAPMEAAIVTFTGTLETDAEAPAAVASPTRAAIVTLPEGVLMVAVNPSATEFPTRAAIVLPMKMEAAEPAAVPFPTVQETTTPLPNVKENDVDPRNTPFSYKSQGTTYVPSLAEAVKLVSSLATIVNPAGIDVMYPWYSLLLSAGKDRLE